MTTAGPDETEALEAWLRIRGRAALAPDPASIDRIGIAAASAFAAQAPSGARRPRSGARPVVAAVFAMALMAASIGGPAWALASESAPGHAFYGIRIASETIGLPAVGTAERAAAEIVRLDRRIAEVREESSARDWSAAEAALRATSEEARSLEVALTAAPDARHDARTRVRDARRALRLVAADASAPLDVRDAARRAEEILERASGGLHR